MKFQEIKKEALGLAGACNCNIALRQALSLCDSEVDLASVAKHAAGPGSQHVCEYLDAAIKAVNEFGYLLEI